MSRILLNNSGAAVVQCATVTVKSVAGKTFQQCKAPNKNIMRRWRSLFDAQQRQIATLSQSAAANVHGLPGTVSLSSSSRINNRPNALLFVRNTSSSSLSSLSTSPTSVTTNSPMSTMPATSPRNLQVDNINPNFITMEYAVRGPLVVRAAEIERELKKGVKKPFDTVIRANIGDCHAMGQRPITFVRQLLALTFEPRLLDSPDYPEDVKKHAREILDGCHGCSVGSYTDSTGLEVVRRQVAAYIERRDGIPSDWRNIYLTAGATTGIKSIISLMRCEVGGAKSGIMVPVPQYPLYSASIAEFGMVKVDYYLDEERNWGLDRKELQRSVDEASKTCKTRAIVVINPGNPTGQVLKRENIVEIIKFAYDNKLVLLADEVYQDNIYDKDSAFFSFKKVATEMGSPYKDMELVSFMSTSKGFLGECGIRGGYMEIMNMDPQVQAMLTKSLTASLCGTTAGQVALSGMVNPPMPGEPSYKQFMDEKNGVLQSLKERSQLVYNALNSLDGFKVNVLQGAMYVFPQIQIPPKAIAAAKAKNMPADTFYAFELLETSGICIVPGSGFGQKPGTYHFRTTILPQPALLKAMMEKFRVFHTDFMKKYK